MTSVVEYRIEGLLVRGGEPEESATWEPWGVVDDLDAPMARDRLAFLAECKERALGGGEQAQTRVLDFRVLRRTVTTSEWEEA